jgi:hypothetical protein
VTFRALITVLNQLEPGWTLLPIESDSVYDKRFVQEHGGGDSQPFVERLFSRLLDAMFGSYVQIKVECKQSELWFTGVVRSNLPQHKLDKISDALSTLFTPIGVRFNDVIHARVLTTDSLS